jgi:hypothetical protein
MRPTVLAAVGCATVLATTAVTTTTHASGGLLGLLGRSHTTQRSHPLASSGTGLLGSGTGLLGSATGLLGSGTGLLGSGSGLVSTGSILPNVLECANILHAGGINLIGSGKDLGVGCDNTALGAGYGVNLITLPPLPATAALGSCQTLLQNVGTMLPVIGFPFSTGAGISTSCGTHPSPLDPLTQLLGLG